MRDVKKDKTAYIIPHTHWDREWRYPIWKNRMLLIEFMDELLDTLDNDSKYQCFLMDGQVAPIDDYLEVRPENKERLMKHIKDGKIAIGPWYTLPDLYPLDGESLVRNLLKGIRVSKRYGDVLKIGYNSFGWGQTSQFPQIYDGFGINFIICAKKVSEERAPESEFIWESPDGTRVLTSRLGKFARANFYFNAYLYAKYGVNCLSPDFKYSPKLSGNAIHNASPSHLDEDFFMVSPKEGYDSALLQEGMKNAWHATDDTTLSDIRLFLNGTDFSTSHPDLSSMIADLNESNPDVLFKNARLEDYAKDVHKHIDKSKLKIIKGELRDGPASDCSGNALSTRIYLKQLNKKAQNLILHKAEPLSSCANMLGIPFEQGLLNKAWIYMLQSHPHDSINGVTQDKTANDVEYRLNQAIEIGQVVADKAVSEIVKNIDLSDYSEEEQILVVFNSHPYPVSEVIEVNIATPQSESVWSMVALDELGGALALQEIARDEKAYPVHDVAARPWPYLTDRHLCSLETGEVPAMGYKVIRFLPKSHFDRTHFYWIDMRKSIGQDIMKTNNVLENEFLKVEINPNGTLKMLDKLNNHVYDGLHYFEDTGDVGNYWAFYPPFHNQTYTTLTGNTQTWCEENGPLQATIAIAYEIELPVRAYESKAGIRGESKRSEEKNTFKIISRITLKKGSRRLDISTSLKNNVNNHRLRVAFPTGIKAEFADASDHFAVTSRSSEPIRDKNGEFWPEMQTLPMQKFIDISDGKKGIALINNCLTEYEFKPDENNTLYLTLFRAMGNMIVTWWEAVGEFADQHGSQMNRDMVFEYSIYPHKGNWDEGKVYVEAETFNVPLAPYHVTGRHSGELAGKHSFMECDNKNLVLSAMKKSEDNENIILRFYNPTQEIQHGMISVHTNIKEAYLCNLNEEREKTLLVHDKYIEIDVKSNQITTIEVVW